MHKALNVITKSVAFEESREIVEHHLDLALLETENNMKKKFRAPFSSLEDNDEVCCGERHCPFKKRNEIPSASSSDSEVDES